MNPVTRLFSVFLPVLTLLACFGGLEVRAESSAAPVVSEINAVFDRNADHAKLGMKFAVSVRPGGIVSLEMRAGNWRLRDELTRDLLGDDELYGEFMAALDEEIPYAEARKALRGTILQVSHVPGVTKVSVEGRLDTETDQRADAEFQSGLKRYESGEYGPALSFFRTAASLGLPRAQRTIGFMYENALGVERDREAGREWYRKAAGEGEGEAFYNLGRMASADKDYTLALAYYQKAIERSPDLSMAYNNIGYLLNDMQHFERAIPFLVKAIELNPEYAGSYSNLGISFDNLGRHDDATETYREALMINPRAADVRVNLGVTLMHQGAYDEAAKEFYHAIHLQPHWHQPYSGLGNIFLEKKDLDLAITAYQGLVRNRPDHPWGFKLLAETYAMKGEYGKAVEAASEALAKARTIPEYDEKITKEIEREYQKYVAAGGSVTNG